MNLNFNPIPHWKTRKRIEQQQRRSRFRAWINQSSPATDGPFTGTKLPSSSASAVQTTVAGAKNKTKTYERNKTKNSLHFTVMQ
jgi:hypothetical protein